MLADFMAEWMDTREEEPQEEEATASGEAEPSYWTMHFDGAFAARSAGAGAVLTSPTGDKLDRKSTRLNSSHITRSRMPSSA